MTTATQTLTIHHSNGNQTRYADTMRDAIRVLKSQYGEDVVIHDEWEPVNFDGSRERKLVWANEEDADNDAGQNAVAEIIRSV